MIVRTGIVCFAALMICRDAGAKPNRYRKESHATADAAVESPEVYAGKRSLDAAGDVRRLQTRQACDVKWSTLDVQHTMCQPDVGVEVSLDQATKLALVQQHNDMRRRVLPTAGDMTVMVWDDELATVAAKWARQCVVGHDSATAHQVPSLPGVNVGQNGAFGQATFAAAVQAWFDERKDFIYGSGAIGTAVVGHYTQVVATRSQRVGCGQALCKGKPYERYYFCNYAVGQYTSDTVRPYTNSSASCSACPAKCDVSGKLCDCKGKVCLNGGSFNISTCSCVCPSLYSGAVCQTLNCPASDKWFCGTSFPPEYCRKYSNVPTECPYMCGLCSKGG